MRRGKGQGQMQERVEAVMEAVRKEGVAAPKRIMEITGLKSGYTSDLIALLVHRGAIERVKGGYRIK